MDIMDAARNVAEDYPGGATALAGRIDKNPTTLLHELKETGGAKLGLRTAVKMTARTHDLRILNAFAAEAGCMVIPLPAALAVEGNEAMRHLAGVAHEFADVIQAGSCSLADDHVSANELGEIERQWGELIAAGQQFLACMRAKHEASKPAQLQRVA